MFTKKLSIFLIFSLPINVFTGNTTSTTTNDPVPTQENKPKKETKQEPEKKEEKKSNETKVIEALLLAHKFDFDKNKIDSMQNKTYTIELDTLTNDPNSSNVQHTFTIGKSGYLDIKASKNSRSNNSDFGYTQVDNFILDANKHICLLASNDKKKYFDVTKPEEKAHLELALQKHSYIELANSSLLFPAIKTLNIYKLKSNEDYLSRISHEHFVEDYENKKDVYSHPNFDNYLTNLIEKCDYKTFDKFSAVITNEHKLEYCQKIIKKLENCPVPLVKFENELEKLISDKKNINSLSLAKQAYVLDRVEKIKKHKESIEFINKFKANEKNSTPENLDKLLSIRRKINQSISLKNRFAIEDNSTHFNKEIINCANNCIKEAKQIQLSTNFTDQGKLVKIVSLVEQAKSSIGDFDKFLNLKDYSDVYKTANDLIKNRTSYSIESINHIGQSIKIPKQELFRIYKSEEQTEIHKEILDQFYEISKINEHEARYSLAQMTRAASNFNQKGNTELARSGVGIVDFFLGMVDEIKSRGLVHVLASLGSKGLSKLATTRGVTAAFSFLAPKLAFAAVPGAIAFEISRFLLAAYNIKQTGLSFSEAKDAFIAGDWHKLGQFFVAATDDVNSSRKYLKYLYKNLNVYHQFVDRSDTAKLMSKADEINEFFKDKANNHKLQDFDLYKISLKKKYGKQNVRYAERILSLGNSREAIYNNANNMDLPSKNLEKTVPLMSDLLSNPRKIIKELNISISEENIVTLEKGGKFLGHIPGFKENSFINALRLNNSKQSFQGPMYEIEKALELTQKGVEIKAMCQVLESVNEFKEIERAEIDIITKCGRFIETKHLSSDIISETSKTRNIDQFLRGSRVSIFNKGSYEVHSKQKLSDYIKDSLKSNNIPFFED